MNVQGNGGGRGDVLAKGEERSPLDHFKAHMRKAMPMMEAVVPRHEDAQRLLEMLFISVERDQSLLKCTPASMLFSVMQILGCGLVPNSPLQQAYIVPFGNRKKVGDQWLTVYEAQPIVGYRGYILLAVQAGDIIDVDGSVVYARDELRPFQGTEQRLEHIPFMGDDPGEMRGVYCTWTLSNGVKKFRLWPKHRIDTYREKYGYNEIFKSGEKTRELKKLYRDHPEAAALKGVIRDSTRFWPLSVERSDKIRRAFAIDDREHQGVGPDFDAERALVRQRAPRLLEDLRDVPGQAAPAAYEIIGPEDPVAPATEPEQSKGAQRSGRRAASAQPQPTLIPDDSRPANPDDDGR